MITNVVDKEKLASKLKLLPNIGPLQKKIIPLLIKKDYWHPSSNKPRIRLMAKKLNIYPSSVHRALYGDKSGKSGAIGLFIRFKSNSHPHETCEQTCEHSPVI